MHRISRYRLFNMLVSDILFDKQLRNRVPDPALYEIIDRFLDRVCSTAVMVAGQPARGRSLLPRRAFRKG